MRISNCNLCQKIAFVGIIMVAGLFSYANTFDAPFVFDDYNIIVKNNPHLQIKELSIASLKGALARSYGKDRPLATITLAVNYYFCQKETFGYHLVNVGVHLLTGVVLFFFLLVTFKTPALTSDTAFDKIQADSAAAWISFLAVLIWLVHPLQTNAVTYIVQRMTSLAALFYVFSLLAYAHARMSVRAGRTALAAALFAGSLVSGLCAVLSKENAATLPVFILLYEWFFLQNLRPIRIKYLIAGGLLGAVFFFGAAYIFLGAHPIERILAEYHQWNFTLPERVMTEFRVIALYISLIFFPFPGRLMMDYDYPISRFVADPQTMIISLAMLILLLGAAVYGAKKRRLLSFCILWFLGNLAIESSIIGIEIIYEHRLYLPSMMICLGVVYSVWHRVQQKKLAVLALFLIALILGFWTYQRNQAWSSDIVFWKDCAVKSPQYARPMQNLAYSLYQKGENAQAVLWYRKSLDYDRRPITSSVTWYNIGLANSKMGYHREAAAAYQQALALNYRAPKVFYQLASESFKTGELEAAANNYRQALEQDSTYLPAKKELEKLKRFWGDCRVREVCLKKLCDDYPENPDLRFRLGNYYEQKGDIRQAAALYQEALWLLPESDREIYLMALGRLAGCRLMEGDVDQALSLNSQGARLAPQQDEFPYELAGIYFFRGDTDSGYAWLEKSIDNGFKSLQRLETDSRFDGVRHQERFEELKIRVRDFSRQ